MDAALLEDGQKFADWFLTSPDELAKHNPFSAQFKCAPIEVTAGKGFARLGFSAHETTTNFLKIVHGGVLGTLLDETASIAAMTMVGWYFRGTVNLNATYIASAKPGSIIGEAKVRAYTKSLLFVDSMLTSEDGRMFAFATVSVAYALEKKPEKTAP